MKVLLAVALLSGASLSTFALAQETGASASQSQALLASAQDARSAASDREVAIARRAYRAQCSRYESTGFCQCVTAGVAQAIPPSDVRLAARTIRERIGAQGDAANSVGATDTDQTSLGAERRVAAFNRTIPGGYCYE